MEILRKMYREKQKEIQGRLRDFELAKYRTDREVFTELCFCILTPGTSALRADAAIKHLVDSKLLFSGEEGKIAEELQKFVRFHNNKASHIVHARKFMNVRRYLTGTTPQKREWLVKNIKGLGWKEASHFLRNIGYWEDIAVIDRHILRNMKEFGIIDAIPESISKNTYMELENKMKEFSQIVGISLEELDLLLWSKETGAVFK